MKNDMKTVDDRICRPGHAPGKAAVLLAGLALMGGTTFVLHAQLLSIEKAGLIAWPDPTEEQIVVGSDSPTGPVWTPWPEPIFKRFGQMCMAVPTVATQQYFKLVPGRQFVDDFSDAWGPFTNRNSWAPLLQDATTEEWVVTNGVLQVKCNSGFQYGFALLPPGMNVLTRHRDFCIAVDVLDWVTSGTNWSGIMLLGRADTSTLINYSGGLQLNRGGIPGKVLPFIHWDIPTTTSIRGSTNDVQLPYRLQFSGVGSRLTLRVLNPTNGQLIEELNTTNAPLAIGVAALYFEGRFNAGDSFTIKVDNFFASGTKP